MSEESNKPESDIAFAPQPASHPSPAQDAENNTLLLEMAYLHPGHIEDGDLLAATLKRPAITEQDATASGNANLGGRVLWNTLLQVAGKFSGFIFGFVNFALVTRLVDKGTFGNYSIVFIYTSFFGALAEAGITTIGVREASKSPHDLDAILGSTTSLKAIGAFLAYGLGVALVYLLPNSVLFYPDDVKLAIVAVSISMFFFSMGTNFDVVFQSRLQTQYAAAADAFFKIFTVASMILLVVYAQTHILSMEQRFAYPILIAAVANVINFLIRWFGATRILRPRLHFDMKRWKILLWMAVPVGIIGILGQIHYKVDSLLLYNILHNHPDAVAIYNVAYKIVDILITFFIVITTITFPVLTRYIDASQERFRQVAQRILDISISLIFPSIVGCILVAPGLISILSGTGYSAAVLPLQILAFSVIPVFVSTIYINIVISLNHQKWLIWIVCINIIVNVGVNLYAIPRYSYIGSAIATDISETLGMIMYISLARRYRKVAPSFAMFLRTIVACAAMAGVIFLLGTIHIKPVTAIDTFSLVAIGAATYGIVLFVIGGLDPLLIYEVRRRIPFLKGSNR